MQHQLNQIAEIIKGQSPENALRSLSEAFGGQIVFSTSLGYEDQLITHFIFSNNLNIRVFSLDTGRLFEQTYQLFQQTLERYKKPIHTYFPDTNAIQNFVSQAGPNCIYESLENRKKCCFIRKVEPLKRALLGHKIWITGIRAEHSPNRHAMQPLEYDETNNIIKFHPLLDYSFEQVKNLVHQFQIPYNPLHDLGFVSIGCAPCTRAVAEDEDFRAGRWWWEQSDKKECGLHQSK